MRYAELGSAKSDATGGCCCLGALPGPAGARIISTQPSPIRRVLLFLRGSPDRRPCVPPIKRSALSLIFSPLQRRHAPLCSFQSLACHFFFLSALLSRSLPFIGRLRRPRLIARICKTRSLNSLSLIPARFGAEEERIKPALVFFTRSLGVDVPAIRQ